MRDFDLVWIVYELDLRKNFQESIQYRLWVDIYS